MISSKVVYIFPPKAKALLALFSHSKCIPALSTYNTESVTLAVRRPWSSGNCVYSCCASGRCFGSQHCCFGFASRDDSFHGSAFCLLFKEVLKTRRTFTFWVRGLGHIAKDFNQSASPNGKISLAVVFAADGKIGTAKHKKA